MSSEYQPPSVDRDSEPLQLDSVEALRDRLDVLLERTGKSHTDLWQAIPMTESGYWKMLRRGSADLRTLIRIGHALGMDVAQVLSDRPPVDAIVSEPLVPYERPKRRYLEERVEWLEAEVRKLKEQLRPR